MGSTRACASAIVSGTALEALPRCLTPANPAPPKPRAPDLICSELVPKRSSDC